MHNPQALLLLTHHRYSIPVIADLWVSDGDKLVTLIYRTGSSEGGMKQTLAYLMDKELVMKNPGYGHPWRPEYILTDKGCTFGVHTSAAVNLAKEQMAQDVAFDKWSLPILSAILGGARRNKDIKAALPDITPRALSQSLANLCAIEWVEKAMLSLHPVRIEYRPTEVGEKWRTILQHLEELLLSSNEP